MTNNKDYLSQEEIDALLRQTMDESSSSDGGAQTIDDYLNSLEQDALGEIGNITFGSAATALSTLLGQKVEITTPKVSLIQRELLENEFPKPHVAVHVNYVDGFKGINLLVIKTLDAQVIANIMLGGDGKVQEEEELNEIHISAVQEAMNQMMGSAATSMSTIFNRFVNISPPGIDILDVAHGQGQSNFPSDDVFVKISFRLKIGDLIDSNIMQLVAVPFAKELVSTLMGGGESSPEELPVAQPSIPMEIPPAAVASQPLSQPQHSIPPAYDQSMPPMQQPPYQQPPMQQPPYQQPMYDPAMMQGMNMPMGQQPMFHTPQNLGAMPNRNINVQPAQFSNFASESSVHADNTNLNLLLDIPLKVTVELGRTQKMIKDILELSQGSIIELDKLAGEPVDILVNNKLVAKGEVVVIDENFGVRVTDIISQWDRIYKLQ